MQTELCGWKRRRAAAVGGGGRHLCVYADIAELVDGRGDVDRCVESLVGVDEGRDPAADLVIRGKA